MTGFGDRSEDKPNAFFSIGPGIGYAYTLVAIQHLFVTGSLTVIPELQFYNETANNQQSEPVYITAGNAFTGWRLVTMAEPGM